MKVEYSYTCINGKWIEETNEIESEKDVKEEEEEEEEEKKKST